MGSGISQRRKSAAESKRVLSHASTSGIVDPRTVLGRECDSQLAETSEAVIQCANRLKWVCLKMSAEHSRDVQRASTLIDTTSSSAILKDRIEITKNVLHNFTQAVIWGEEADFVNTRKHRVIIDSLQFKLNFEGALQRQVNKAQYFRMAFGSAMTVKQKPPSINGRFPVCAHYWWKSEDLMAIILNHIPMAQLGKVSLVHKVWHAASKQISDVILTKPVRGDRLLEAQCYYHNPTSLAITSMYNVSPGIWFRFFSYAYQNFKQLTTLNLKNCSSVVDDDLVPICEHCVSLKSLSLVSLAGLVRPKITSIALQNLIIEDCVWFEQLVGFIPCITDVSLVRLNCMHGSGFDKTCTVLGIIDEKSSESTLKSFIIKQCNGVIDLVIKSQSVEAIRIFVCGSLAHCTIDANKATLLAISQCYNLSTLQIKVPLLKRVVIQDVKSLFKADIMCPIAEHITFQDINHTTNSTLQSAMNNFQSLKTCRMANIGSASQFPFGSHFKCFTFVTTFFASQCVFDDSALAVLTQLEKLKQFELWDCPALTCPRFIFSLSLAAFSCNHCMNLFSFEIQAHGMTEFLISKCHSLKEVEIKARKLKNAVFNFCERIAELHIESESLADLDLENIHRIERFSCNIPALQNFCIKHAHEPPCAAMMHSLLKSKNITTISLEDLSGFTSFQMYHQQPEWIRVQSLELQHVALQDDACDFIQNMSGLLRLSIRHCNGFNRIKLIGMRALKTLRIEDCINLSETDISAPMIQTIFIQNCQHLLCAIISGRHLEAVSFHKTESLFMLDSTDGCPSLKIITFSKAIDIQVVCKAFCKAAELMVQVRNKSQLIMMGELQMRHVVGESQQSK
jgi:hypothetical protein